MQSTEADQAMGIGCEGERAEADSLEEKAKAQDGLGEVKLQNNLEEESSQEPAGGDMEDIEKYDIATPRGTMQEKLRECFARAACSIADWMIDGSLPESQEAVMNRAKVLFEVCNYGELEAKTIATMLEQAKTTASAIVKTIQNDALMGAIITEGIGADVMQNLSRALAAKEKASANPSSNHAGPAFSLEGTGGGTVGVSSHAGAGSALLLGGIGGGIAGTSAAGNSSLFGGPSDSGALLGGEASSISFTKTSTLAGNKAAVSACGQKGGGLLCLTDTSDGFTAVGKKMHKTDPGIGKQSGRKLPTKDEINMNSVELPGGIRLRREFYSAPNVPITIPTDKSVEEILYPDEKGKFQLPPGWYVLAFSYETKPPKENPQKSTNTYFKIYQPVVFLNSMVPIRSKAGISAKCKTDELPKDLAGTLVAGDFVIGMVGWELNAWGGWRELLVHGSGVRKTLCPDDLQMNPKTEVGPKPDDVSPKKRKDSKSTEMVALGKTFSNMAEFADAIIKKCSEDTDEKIKGVEERLNKTMVDKFAEAATRQNTSDEKQDNVMKMLAKLCLKSGIALDDEPPAAAGASTDGDVTMAIDDKKKDQVGV
eukprot:g8600.t1